MNVGRLILLAAVTEATQTDKNKKGKINNNIIIFSCYLFKEWASLTLI